jgi:GTP cyclohydrolase II
MAKRLNVEEGVLRRILFQESGGMYPELITRPDLKVWLPPIGSTTVYIFGNPQDLSNPNIELSCRVHDECNGSDVFGSDICTCRPYLMYGIEHAAETAQKGGVGIIAYYRKEGRALGEVTKFLVYNARKRQEGGDSAATYFKRTECVAGVEDARFQEFMPDVLHFFGIKKIHNLHSMSNMKYNAIVNSGIEVVNRVSIPDELIPKDAQVEMEAKKAAGYFTEGEIKKGDDLQKVKGRDIT